MQNGIALTQGNLGNRIRIRLPNGRIIYAIAQTNIIGGQVGVFQDTVTKQWFCFSASPPVFQLTRSQKLFKSRPIKQKPVINDVYILYTIIRFKENRTMPLGGTWTWYDLDYYLRLPEGKPKLLVSVPFSFARDFPNLFSFGGGFINYGVLSFDKNGNWMVTVVNYWAEQIRNETIPLVFSGNRTTYVDYHHYFNMYFIKDNDVQEINHSTIERTINKTTYISYTRYPFSQSTDDFIQREWTTTLENNNFCVLVPIKQDYFINFPTNHYKQTNKTLKEIAPTNNWGDIRNEALANYDYIYSRVHQYALLNEDRELTLSQPVALPDAIYHAEEVVESYPNGNSGVSQNNPATVSDLQGSRSWNRSYLLPNKLEITETYIPDGAGYMPATDAWAIINSSDLSPILINVDKTECFYIDEVISPFNINVELPDGSIVQRYIELYNRYKLFHYDGTVKREVNKIPIELFEYINQYEGLSLMGWAVDDLEDTFYSDRAISYHWDKNKITFPFYKAGIDYRFDWRELFRNNSNFKQKTVKIDFLECSVSIDEDSNTVQILRGKIFKAKTTPFVKSNGALVDRPSFNLNDGDNRYGFRIMSIALKST
jgi:hypothetical protein